MVSPISRVFMNGNSQAIRIPQEFRLNASCVRITRNDNGDLVIHPLAADRGTALLDVLAAFEPSLAAELAARIESDRREQVPAQERERL
jgi:antitoxin VapB